MTTLSAYLDIKIPKDNDTVSRKTARLVVGDSIDPKRNIIAYAYETNSKMKLTRRKLESRGNIKSYCGFVNSAKNLKRYEKMTTIAESMVEIEGMQATGRENKQREFEDEMK